MEKQEFIGNYLENNKRLKNHKLHYGMQYLSLLASVEQEAESEWEKYKKENKKCMCLKCSPNKTPNRRFNVCSICGNKRCPHASDHNFECTNSNEVGQKGSIYQ